MVQVVLCAEKFQISNKSQLRSFRLTEPNHSSLLHHVHRWAEKTAPIGQHHGACCEVCQSLCQDILSVVYGHLHKWGLGDFVFIRKICSHRRQWGPASKSDGSQLQDKGHSTEVTYTALTSTAILGARRPSRQTEDGQEIIFNLCWV